MKIPELTPREMLILQMICKEYTNAQIAKKLNLSIRTVEVHRGKLIAKIGARNILGVFRYALKQGWVKL
ncbi:MAG TPA: helix-turn-helix transcriptional regulator [Flavisolibacter sp.]|jgi:DNA-binding CsgD family transcriptional regulator|nr:helix-turn-helix transcriptional regulator [Flavisolibacter sp.]